MAKNGFYVKLGNGSSKCQHVYVRNIAFAHILAAAELINGNKKIAGNAYFITDGPGSNFFGFFDQIVEGAGYKIFPKNFRIPKWPAFAIASIVEFFAFILRPIKKTNPEFSRFAVMYTCNDFTFTSDRAKTDFGYEPKYLKEEAIERTIEFYKKG